MGIMGEGRKFIFQGLLHIQMGLCGPKRVLFNLDLVLDYLDLFIMSKRETEERSIWLIPDEFWI